MATLDFGVHFLAHVCVAWVSCALWVNLSACCGGVILSALLILSRCFMSLLLANSGERLKTLKTLKKLFIIAILKKESYYIYERKPRKEKNRDGKNKSNHQHKRIKK